jgi:hypothetical protein
MRGRGVSFQKVVGQGQKGGHETTIRNGLLGKLIDAGSVSSDRRQWNVPEARGCMMMNRTAESPLRTQVGSQSRKSGGSCCSRLFAGRRRRRSWRIGELDGDRLI